MKSAVFVTGNKNKLLEAKSILPFPIISQNIEVDEIQSLDIRKIVQDKLRKAYAQVKKPVLVDDVSAELESLNGLPGTFIKFSSRNWEKLRYISYQNSRMTALK